MSRLGSRTIVALTGVVSLLLAVSIAPAAAQSDRSSPVGLGFTGIGARIGVVDPEDASSTVMLGLHLDMGQAVRGVHVVPSLEYWSVGVSGLDISDVAISTDIDIDFPLSEQRVTPYLGGGLGIHFLSQDLPPPAGDDSKTKLGLNVQGGIRNNVMPNFDLFGEIRYSFVKDANQLKVLGGFTYRFIY